MTKLTMPVFVTTRDNNTVINKLLSFIGFSKVGSPWSSSRGDYTLSLWLNKPATTESINEAEVPEELVNVLRSKGYKLLGSGVDQYAFLEPGTGQVLKIFGTEPVFFGPPRRGYSKAQEMAIFWINYCKEHADNPFLPKFSDWAPFVFNKQKYLQIRMERLGKFPYNCNWELAEIASAVDSYGRFNLDGYLRSTLRYDEDMRLQTHLGGDGIKLLWDTLKDILAVGKKHRWYYDLHQGNFLIRNDGTPVIVDPWIE
jgi:hypothetical protein